MWFILSTTINTLFLKESFLNKTENPGLFLIQMFFDSKSDEIVNIYSQAFPDEQSKVVILLNDLDPSNSNKYQNITKTNMKD